ncbi:MAG: NrsF family protein [Polyangiaceae bacterium]
MTLPSDLKARVLDAAKREPSPTREEHQKKTMQIALAGIVGALIVFLGTGGPDMGQRSASFYATSFALLAAMSIIVTVLSLGVFKKSMTGAPTDTLVVIALAAAPAVWGIELALRTIWPQNYGHPATLQSTVICFLCTMGMALGPMLALLRVRRFTDAVHPAALGAAFGASAGAWGAVLIDLHCASNDLAHIAWAHALPVLLLAGAGALIGKKLLAPKAA